MRIMDVKEFREKIAALPPMQEASTYPRFTWERRQAELRKQIARDDPRDFLTWATVHEALFVGDGPTVKPQFEALLRNDWQRWRRGVREVDFGKPSRLKVHEQTSGNMVHQAYILKQWEDAARERVENLDSIFEFGGGYGSMARLCAQLGFDGAYCIYDLPELLLLQEFYLSNVGIDNVIFVQRPPADIEFGLFIGACSLSEVPFELRDKILNEVNAQGYVILYQGQYTGRNNHQYFQSWKETRPDLTWIDYQTEYLDYHRFLVGVS